MQFAKDLYLSEGLIRKKKELIIRLKTRKIKKVVYVVYFNHDSDTPEFINSLFLRQKYYKKYPMYVIGIVETYEQALNYLAGLLENSFRKKGNFNIKENYREC